MLRKISKNERCALFSKVSDPIIEEISEVSNQNCPRKMNKLLTLSMQVLHLNPVISNWNDAAQRTHILMQILL